MNLSEFNCTCRMRQIYVLLPYLFILTNYAIVDIILTIKIIFGYWKLQSVFITEIIFRNLPSSIRIRKEETQRRPMTINVNKTKSVIVSKTIMKHFVRLSNQQREQVFTFKYLDLTINGPETKRLETPTTSNPF